MLFNYSKKYRIIDICQIAAIDSIWLTIAYLAIGIRPIIGEGFFPFFYFLIWLTGLFFSPQKAFITSFIGHFLFDLITYFNIIFIFIWIASAISSFLVSWIKKNFWGLRSMIFLIPFFYFCAFLMIGQIYFGDSIRYFKAYPIVFIAVVFVNPLFNFFVFFYLIWPKFIHSKDRKTLNYFQIKSLKLLH